MTVTAALLLPEVKHILPTLALPRIQPQRGFRLLLLDEAQKQLIIFGVLEGVDGVGQPFELQGAVEAFHFEQEGAFEGLSLGVGGLNGEGGTALRDGEEVWLLMLG
jgi:hypothetical protein